MEQKRFRSKKQQKQDDIDKFFLLREIRTKEEVLQRNVKIGLEDEFIKNKIFPFILFISGCVILFLILLILKL